MADRTKEASQQGGKMVNCDQCIELNRREGELRPMGFREIRWSVIFCGVLVGIVTLVMFVILVVLAGRRDFNFAIPVVISTIVGIFLTQEDFVQFWRGNLWGTQIELFVDNAENLHAHIVHRSEHLIRTGFILTLGGLFPRHRYYGSIARRAWQVVGHIKDLSSLTVRDSSGIKLSGISHMSLLELAATVDNVQQLLNVPAQLEVIKRQLEQKGDECRELLEGLETTRRSMSGMLERIMRATLDPSDEFFSVIPYNLQALNCDHRVIEEVRRIKSALLEKELLSTGLVNGLRSVIREINAGRDTIGRSAHAKAIRTRIETLLASYGYAIDEETSTPKPVS